MNETIQTEERIYLADGTEFRIGDPYGMVTEGNVGIGIYEYDHPEPKVFIDISPGDLHNLGHLLSFYAQRPNP
jgi:hypothetical protein